MCLHAAIVCPALPLPIDGQISFSASSYTVNVTATYSCNTGYGLTGGDAVLPCEGDGSSTTGAWIGTPASCEGMKRSVHVCIHNKVC